MRIETCDGVGGLPPMTAALSRRRERDSASTCPTQSAAPSAFCSTPLLLRLFFHLTLLLKLLAFTSCFVEQFKGEN